MAVPPVIKAQTHVFKAASIYKPAPSNVAKPNSARHTLQHAVSLGGQTLHHTHPPKSAEHNLLGSLPAPVKRTLGGRY